MKSAWLAALAAAPVLLCVRPSLAAPETTEPAAAEAAIPLEPVLVTASRSPQPQSDIGAATIVIDRARIVAAQVGDIAELLRYEAGIDLGRNGGPGQLTSVFVRGGESNHTLVLIDGVRVNPATAGGAALQNLATDSIERIEIVKGPRSTLYGSDALAATINIITRRPEARRIEASVRGGSFGTVDASASYGDRIDGVGLFVQTEQQRTDGVPACAGGPADSGFRSQSFNARLDVAAGPATLEARAFHTQGKAETYDSCSPAFGLNPTAQDFRNQVLALAATVTPTERWTSTLTFSRGEDRIRQYASADTVRTIRPMLDWQNTVAVSPAFGLVFGAQAWQDRIDALSFGSTIHETVRQLNGFMQGRFDSRRHHLQLAVSGLDHEAFGARATWNADYGFHLNPDSAHRSTLVVAAGTGFRAPDASDRFGFGGNPALDPERALNLEAGIRQRLGRSQQVDLRAFRTRTRDLISVEFDPSNDPAVDFGFRAVNIDRARNEGLEARWQYAHAGWQANVSGIVQNPKDRSDDSPLLRRSRRSLSAQLRHDFGRAWAATDVLGTADRADIDAATGAPVKGSGYTLWGLSAGVRVAGGVELGARVENLLDRDYQTAAGYDALGRAVYGTLRWVR